MSPYLSWTHVSAYPYLYIELTAYGIPLLMYKKPSHMGREGW